VKKIPGLLSVLVILCLAGTFTQALAQSDETSIIPITKLLNSSGALVRGVSDDGKRIVFESTSDYTGGNPDFNREVFVYDADSRTIIQITSTKNVPEDPNDATKGVHINVSNNAPAISGDGTRIVFSSNAGDQLTDTSPNPDGNQEIYLAILPRGATTATFLRITDTPASRTTFPIGPNDAFDNYTPTVNFDGTLIGFVSTRGAFNALDNGTPAFTVDNRNMAGTANCQSSLPNAKIFLYNVTAKQYTQVTRACDEDATVNFQVRGFNSNPFLSGNGKVLVFLSAFNYAGKNGDFNGEVFLYNVGDPINQLTQITDTTGNAAVPVGGAMNVLSPSLRHLNHDGTLLVFESAGDLAGKNTDKTRELFLYNTATKSFTQITDQTLPANPTAADQAKIDFNFFPSINAAGTFITFASFLNLPVTNDPKVDNADNSKEVFRYDIANSTPTGPKFRQMTVTQPSASFLDQRQNTIPSYVDNSGSRVTFTMVSNDLSPTLTFAPEVFQEIIRPITSKNDQAVMLANAASFDATQVARGSIVAGFGTNLANATTSASSANLPYDLAGVSVTVKGFAARLVFVSAGQINFVLPQEVAAADSVDFTVNNNGVLSAGKVKVADVAPGIFTVTGDGTGMAAAQCGRGSDDGLTFEISSLPCSVGNEASFNTLILYGTGWRNASGTAVNFKVGDTQVMLTPSFSGAQPTFFGLDQINVTLTKDLAGKAPVDTTVTAASGSTTATSQASVNTSFLPFEEVVTVANAASFDTTAVARGSIATASGTQLANSTITAPNDNPPFELGGVKVTVAGLPARLLFVSPTQINFIVPQEVVPADLVGVTVNNNGTVSRGRIKVTDAAPGVFTTSGDGTGPAVAMCGKVLADGTTVFSAPPCSVGTAAAPNFLALFGTGWRNAMSTTVNIGGIDLTVTYSGPQGSLLGFDQINVTLVPELAGKTDVDVIVTAVSGSTTTASKAGVKISFLP